MTVIEKSISVGASRETVWRYLEDPELLAGWLMRNNFSGRVGDDFQFFARPSGDWNGVLNCRLVEFDPPRRIAFTWDANDIQCETLVTIELLEESGGTRIRLLHSNFNMAAADAEAIVRQHDEGWSEHLDFLRTQLRGELGQEDPVPGPVDWTRFDLHVAIDASPDKVLGAWSTTDGMESFFVQMMRITGPDGVARRADEPARPGDRYIWRWPTGRRLRGEFLPGETGREVRFTFGDSRVCAAVRPYRNGTMLRLTQYNIPDTETDRMHIHANCRGAWVHFLSVLKTWLETGVDGRDMSPGTGTSYATSFDPASVGVTF